MSTGSARSGAGLLGVAVAAAVVVGALLSEWCIEALPDAGAECLGRRARLIEGAILAAGALATAALLLRRAAGAAAGAAARPAARRAARAQCALQKVPPVRRAVAALLFLAGVLAAFGWSQARTVFTPVDDLARLPPRDPLAEGPHVRVRGVVLDRPITSARRGSMSDFDRRPPRWRFRLLVSEIDVGGSNWVPCTGRLSVGFSARQAPVDVSPGSRVEVAGRLTGFAPRMNPGGFDARAWARRERLSAAFWIEGPQAIAVVAEDPAGTAEDRHWFGRSTLRVGWPGVAAETHRRLIALRGSLRALAEESLLTGLPASTDPEIRALLVAMFLGRRDPALADLEGAFRRTGAVHLVAISGFNLAVLAAAAMVLARLGRLRRPPVSWPPPPPAATGERAEATRLHPASAVVMGLVALYLVVVEDQPAVMRAGAMILVAKAGELLGRSWTSRGVYCLAAVVLLLWRPADVANAGFQLSFAVVAALIWLAPRLRRQWFGRHERDGASLPKVLGRSLASAVAAAVAAWLVAMPLSLHHFGVLSPLAAPLSLLAIPVASALLVVGYAKILLTPLIPPIASLSGWILSALAGTLAGLVRAADELPGSAIQVPPPGPGWTLLMLAALLAALAGLRPRTRRIAWIASFLLALWPLRALVPRSDGPVLRVDCLAVGDGTCILLRSSGRAALFDCGSTNFAVGERTVVPALLALGVRGLDSVLVSHANLDHFAAVIEVADALPVAEVVVPPQLLALAEVQPRGPAATLLRELEARAVPIRAGARGDRRAFGATTWRWLHPEPSDRFRRINDTSQVVLVEAAGTRLLLCGDIEVEAMALLRRREPGLSAEIVELPHHGSWREAAAAFVSDLRPTLVLQSTGRRRAQDPRWNAVLEGVERLVTARDGAVWAEVDADGRVRTGSTRRMPQGPRRNRRRSERRRRRSPRSGGSYPASCFWPRATFTT